MPSSECTPSVASEIIMRRIQPGKKHETFVMVEGETDKVLWEEFRNKKCYLHEVPEGEGKDYIVKELKSCNGLPGIAAIVDADYWLITPPDELSTDNLLYDDCCPDMELILLNSPALKKTLRHTFYKYEIEQIHEFAEKLKEESLRLAAELGYFRLLNHIEGCGLNFKMYRLKDFIDRYTLELDRDLFARRLAERKTWISSKALLQGIEELREKYPREEYNIQLCRGKDALDIMVYILPTLFKSQIGDDLPHSMNDKELSRTLRMSYERGYFEKTSLFSCIREWESNNVPFRIIRQEG